MLPSSPMIASSGRAARMTAAAAWPTVLAHTLAQANPSTGVLQALGFTRTAEIDSEDGLIWRWELPLRAEDVQLID